MYHKGRIMLLYVMASPGGGTGLVAALCYLLMTGQTSGSRNTFQLVEAGSSTGSIYLCNCRVAYA